MLWEFTLDLNPVWCREVWLLQKAQQCCGAPTFRYTSRWLGLPEFPGSKLCYQCIFVTVLLSCLWFLIATRFVLIFYFCRLSGSCVIALLCYSDCYYQALLLTLFAECLGNLSLARYKAQAHRYGMEAQANSYSHSTSAWKISKHFEYLIVNTT